MHALHRFLPWLLFFLLALPSWAEEFASPVNTERAPGQVDIDALYELGVADYVAGDYDQALEIAKKLINLAPDVDHGYWLRGIVKAEVNQDYEGAIADLERATRLAPYNENAWGGRCWYQILLGTFDEARFSCEKALSLDSDNYAWAVDLGHTYLLDGDYDSA